MLFSQLREMSKRRIFERDRQFREHARKVLDAFGVFKECVLCHSRDNLDIHHINTNELDNSLGNLIYLCRSCHSLVHNWGISVYNDFTYSGICGACGKRNRWLLRLPSGGFVCQSCFDRCRHISSGWIPQ